MSDKVQDSVDDVLAKASRLGRMSAAAMGSPLADRGSLDLSLAAVADHARNVSSAPSRSGEPAPSPSPSPSAHDAAVQTPAQPAYRSPTLFRQKDTQDQPAVRAAVPAAPPAPEDVAPPAPEDFAPPLAVLAADPGSSVQDAATRAVTAPVPAATALSGAGLRTPTAPAVGTAQRLQLAQTLQRLADARRQVAGRLSVTAIALQSRSAQTLQGLSQTRLHMTRRLSAAAIGVQAGSAQTLRRLSDARRHATRRLSAAAISAQASSAQTLQRLSDARLHTTRRLSAAANGAQASSLDALQRLSDARRRAAPRLSVLAIAAQAAVLALARQGAAMAVHAGATIRARQRWAGGAGVALALVGGLAIFVSHAPRKETTATGSGNVTGRVVEPLHAAPGSAGPATVRHVAAATPRPAAAVPTAAPAVTSVMPVTPVTAAPPAPPPLVEPVVTAAAAAGPSQAQAPQPARSAALPGPLTGLVIERGDMGNTALAGQVLNGSRAGSAGQADGISANGWAASLAALAVQPRVAVVRYDALQAARRAPASARIPRLEIVAPLTLEPIYLVVRADSPLRFVHEIAGKAINAGNARSSRALTIDTLYRGLFNAQLPAHPLGAQDEAAALDSLRAGKLDVVALVGSAAGAGFADLLAARGGQFKLLAFDVQQPNAQKALGSFLPVQALPGSLGGFPSVRTPTLGVMSFLVTAQAADDDARTRLMTALAGDLCTGRGRSHGANGLSAWQRVSPTQKLDVGWPYSDVAQRLLTRCSGDGPTVAKTTYAGPS